MSGAASCSVDDAPASNFNIGSPGGCHTTGVCDTGLGGGDSCNAWYVYPIFSCYGGVQWVNAVTPRPLREEWQLVRVSVKRHRVLLRQSS
jgi:hypothetical protein